MILSNDFIGHLLTLFGTRLLSWREHEHEVARSLSARTTRGAFSPALLGATFNATHTSYCTP